MNCGMDFLMGKVIIKPVDLGEAYFRVQTHKILAEWKTPHTGPNFRVFFMLSL